MLSMCKSQAFSTSSPFYLLASEVVLVTKVTSEIRLRFPSMDRLRGGGDGAERGQGGHW